MSSSTRRPCQNLTFHPAPTAFCPSLQGPAQLNNAFGLNDYSGTCMCHIFTRHAPQSDPSLSWHVDMNEGYLAGSIMAEVQPRA